MDGTGLRLHRGLRHVACGDPGLNKTANAAMSLTWGRAPWSLLSAGGWRRVRENDEVAKTIRIDASTLDLQQPAPLADTGNYSEKVRHAASQEC